jgi:hypothetical protein
MYQIWPETSTSDITNCPLGRFCLCKPWVSLYQLELELRIPTLFRPYQRHIADVDLKEIVLSSPSLKLAHGLNERSALNISDSTTQLRQELASDKSPIKGVAYFN